MNYCELWRFAKEAYEGSGGFSDGSYLDKYPRERDEKYKQRKNIAYYTNLFSSKVDRFIGYIFKQKPSRFTSSRLLKIILDDIDNRQNNADVFFSNFAKIAKVYGCNLVLIDMPKELPGSLSDQIENRALPYVIQIDPQKLINYKLNSYGNFEFVIFNDTLDLSTKDKQDIRPIKRYYDRNSWAIYNEKDEVIERGEHNLGVTPLLIFSENGSFPTIGEFTQIASLAKRHYNLQSELDEILRGQTFSILTLQSSSGGDISLSTDNALIYQKDTNRPEFIAPPAAPAEVYQQRIKEIEKQIDTIAYDITTNERQESGIALTLKFQGLNSSLSNFAQRLEDFELRVYEVIFKYLNEEFDITVNYAKEFSIVDIEKEIAILEQMQELITAPTYFKLKAMQIVTNDLNTINLEDLAKIENEIEDSMKGEPK